MSRKIEWAGRGGEIREAQAPAWLIPLLFMLHFMRSKLNQDINIFFFCWKQTICEQDKPRERKIALMKNLCYYDCFAIPGQLNSKVPANQVLIYHQQV